MTAFQKTALLFIAIYIAVVVVRFRRSTVVLTGGLAAVGLYTLAAYAVGQITPNEIGLGSHSLLLTVGFAVVWLGLMLAYSPLADRIASRWFHKPPTLGTFRALQESTAKLIAGIVIAWVLGGFLEELAFRGIVLKAVDSFMSQWLDAWIAAAVAVCVAATGAGLMHLYQGPRAAVIITQLSVLFGVLFVVSGYNLWAVILCHGLYDTVAFIRFATGKSKHSKLDRDAAVPSETVAQ